MSKLAPSSQIVLSAAELYCLSQVADGADVTSPFLAHVIREIHQRRPDLLYITPPMKRYHETDELPLLGAICTKAGKRLIRKTMEALA